MSELRRLTEELQVVANKELNEVSSRIEDDLSHVRERFKRQPHLKYKDDDQWLIAFLRGCKYSLQKAKEKIDYFYTLRTLIPELFVDRDPYSPGNQEVLKSGCIFPLPRTKGPAGPRVFIFSFKDPETTPLVNLLRVYLMSLDISMREDDNSVVSGIYMWVDYSNLSSGYIPQYTPNFIRNGIFCLFQMYPLRLNGVCSINTPSIFENVINFAKSLSSNKIGERLVVYSKDNLENVYKHIPKEILPKEFGGSCESVQELGERWRRKVESYREWFLEDAKYYSNEEKRIGPPKTSVMLGTEGSFRKLDID